MDQHSLERFRRRAALFKATPARKMLSAPWRMGLSYAVAKFCYSKGRILRKTARTFWGNPMNVILPEPVSTSIYRYEFFEAGLTATFIKLLRPGMTVFDVGAHFGYFSMLASELVGPTGAVHSFEPTPSTFDMLRSNVSERGNVTLNNCAVFSEDTEMQFQDFGVVHSAYNSLRGTRLPDSLLGQTKVVQCKVAAKSLDGYIRSIGKVPDFIKIDAENAELDILHGMKQTLAGTGRPMISLETGPDCVGTDQSAGTIGFLVTHGYHVFEYDETAEQLREHEVRAKYGYDNVLMVPPERLEMVRAA